MVILSKGWWSCIQLQNWFITVLKRARKKERFYFKRTLRSAWMAKHSQWQMKRRLTTLNARIVRNGNRWSSPQFSMRSTDWIWINCHKKLSIYLSRATEIIKEIKGDIPSPILTTNCLAFISYIPSKNTNYCWLF